MTASHAATVMTVRGPITAASLGLTLTHEHLFNDIRGAVVPGSRPGTEDLLDAPVTGALAGRLRTEPYSSLDNCTLNHSTDALAELAAFAALGGSSVVDVTPPSLGRRPQDLRELSERSGVNIVMGSGWYLEKFEGERTDAQRLAEQLNGEFEHGIAGEDSDPVFPGVIGEIGVSVDFTPGERTALEAACFVQRQQNVPLFIHLPGWQRRANEVLDLVLGSMQVDPAAVVLCHMDPSGADRDYQRSVADRGVWLEFDMIGMPFSYPGEGDSPAVADTLSAIQALVRYGASSQLLLSHDLFLKAMLSRHGGNGLSFVPGAFRQQLDDLGIDTAALLHHNPTTLFVQAAQGAQKANEL